MPSRSTDSLLSAIRQHNLLDSKQMEKISEIAFADADALLSELQERGWLTAYQAKQLLDGKESDLVLDSYIFLDRVGEGGMGEVFKARHRELKRICAIKVIRKERLSAPNAVRRFQREAKAAAAMSHPNCVVVFDGGESGDKHFFVMEYVEGAIDLAKVVKNGPISVVRSCDYIRQAALGLQHIHEKGVVHRDVKPDNLLLTEAGVVKVLDLGVARLPEDASSTLTVDGTILGSWDYVAPEQVDHAHKVDITADIYSLGCTFYHLLTGRVPFDGTRLQKLYAHKYSEPMSVESLRSDVPSNIAMIVRKMMAKKPEDRYQIPSEVAKYLDELPQDKQADVETGEIEPVSQSQPKGGEREAGEIIKNSLGMKFAWIPPGTFLMGSPKGEAERHDNESQHKVTLSRGFYLGAHLVTQEQWQAVMGNNPSNFKGEKNLPVEQVSWEDCQEFIKKLRDKDKKTYRLPTEAEWEYACRAGKKTPFHFGETISTDQANCDGNRTYGNGKKGVYRQKTTPVGSFPANAWGLFDTHGNLWEWCQDWLGDYPQDDVADPQGPNEGQYRVLRGGSWNHDPGYCRSAYRLWHGPGLRDGSFGFRLCFCLD